MRAPDKTNAGKRVWICGLRRFPGPGPPLTCGLMSSQVLRRLPVPPHDDAALLARLSARFAQTAADLDRSGAFPRDNFAALHEHGLIALVAPRALGGGGASLEAARRVLAAVASGEPAT